jgi:hypothetical protein
LEISVGDTSTAYISFRWPSISRVVMPREYIEIILSSKPVKRVWLCAGHAQQLGCASPLPNLMEVKG